MYIHCDLTSLSCILPAVSIKTTSKLFSLAVKRLNTVMKQRLYKLRTIIDGFLRDTSSIFAISSFIQLNTAFAGSNPVDAKHAEIAYMNSQLFYGSAPTIA
jgi:hypothetical protein